MIWSWILIFFYKIIEFMISWLPDMSDTSSFTTAINKATEYISGVHSFLPYITTALLLIIGFDLIFELSYFIFKIIYWIIRRLPTQS